ncbi:RedB protein [Granulosicoccus antarcticus]|uniref:Thioredoxin domain-containing protein n=1 Tax=Granulosicoccus antarcticus IMCC3135 TaxID=1192854 RepID=A0A2Z2NMU8_9GAMM|nr:RedB protein [Granulosicoccus antarcticus]ASJ70200.1 hypothetical protein IMCC3135_00370 [Granulosicoccus antarcticus IMCC3135]
MMSQSDKRLGAMIGLWLGLAGTALFVMADYGSQPGQAGVAPTLWPSEASSGIVPTTGKPTVVLFAHPLCPCTRATLVELEGMTNRLYGQFDLHVLFYQPADVSAMPDIWAASDLRRIANSLPGTQSHTDVDGELAKYFGAYTSGQVLLYGTDAKLRFAGGITPSRGHAGSNRGSATLISSILGDTGVDPLAPVLNPVFGCGLHEERDDDRKLPTGLVSQHSQELQNPLNNQNRKYRQTPMILANRV